MFEDILGYLIWAGLLVIVALSALILKALIGGGAARGADMVLASSTQTANGPSNPPAGGSDGDDEPEEAPVREESESQRLTRTEKELGEREAKMKAEKIRELQEREKVVKRREDEEKAPPEPQKPKDELTSEKARLMDLIRKAEERYASGELEEKNFKRIVSSYQQQILDLDIQLKKRR
jgi:hypothetical protein